MKINNYKMKTYLQVQNTCRIIKTAASLLLAYFNKHLNHLQVT